MSTLPSRASQPKAKVTSSPESLSLDLRQCLGATLIQHFPNLSSSFTNLPFDFHLLRTSSVNSAIIPLTLKFTFPNGMNSAVAASNPTFPFLDLD